MNTYTNTIEQIADAIGIAAYTLPDGTTQNFPVLTQLPKLVKELVDFKKAHTEAVEYRMLDINETLQEGDEFYGHFGWTKALVLNKVLGERYRRPLTEAELSRKWSAKEIVLDSLDYTEGGKYKSLNRGDLIMDGDEILWSGKWWKATNAGSIVGKGDWSVLHYRRPVTSETQPLQESKAHKAHVQAAKDILQRKIRGSMLDSGFRDTGLDDFVDILLKAVKTAEK
jgi:hypothetical protein